MNSPTLFTFLSLNFPWPKYAEMKEAIDRSFLKDFGVHLYKLRKSKRLSHRKMAQNCRIDHADIKKYENGETNISLLTLKELAKGLGLKPKELLDF